MYIYIYIYVYIHVFQTCLYLGVHIHDTYILTVHVCVCIYIYILCMYIIGRCTYLERTNPDCISSPNFFGLNYDEAQLDKWHHWGVLTVGVKAGVRSGTRPCFEFREWNLPNQDARAWIKKATLQTMGSTMYFGFPTHLRPAAWCLSIIWRFPEIGVP